ncbi:hypothetical protein V1525DRAFT_402547 [Lipomyces kononenkoae]|uniref:Uncharacterized protein n=1 Tax=Lipomyces kononenkoae TaxID=34357 RepID=A0ACC3T3H3_LIPKO
MLPHPTVAQAGIAREDHAPRMAIVFKTVRAPDPRPPIANASTTSASSSSAASAASPKPRPPDQLNHDRPRRLLRRNSVLNDNTPAPSSPSAKTVAVTSTTTRRKRPRVTDPDRHYNKVVANNAKHTTPTVRHGQDEQQLDARFARLDANIDDLLSQALPSAPDHDDDDDPDTITMRTLNHILDRHRALLATKLRAANRRRRLEVDKVRKVTVAERENIWVRHLSKCFDLRADMISDVGHRIDARVSTAKASDPVVDNDCNPHIGCTLEPVPKGLSLDEISKDVALIRASKRPHLQSPTSSPEIMSINKNSHTLSDLVAALVDITETTATSPKHQSSMTMKSLYIASIQVENDKPEPETNAISAEPSYHRPTSVPLPPDHQGPLSYQPDLQPRYSPPRPPPVLGQDPNVPAHPTPQYNREYSQSHAPLLPPPPPPQVQPSPPRPQFSYSLPQEQPHAQHYHPHQHRPSQYSHVPSPQQQQYYPPLRQLQYPPPHQQYQGWHQPPPPPSQQQQQPLHQPPQYTSQQQPPPPPHSYPRGQQPPLPDYSLQYHNQSQQYSQPVQHDGRPPPHHVHQHGDHHEYHQPPPPTGAAAYNAHSTDYQQYPAYQNRYSYPPQPPEQYNYSHQHEYHYQPGQVTVPQPAAGYPQYQHAGYNSSAAAQSASTGTTTRGQSVIPDDRHYYTPDSVRPDMGTYRGRQEYEYSQDQQAQARNRHDGWLTYPLSTSTSSRQSHDQHADNPSRYEYPPRLPKWTGPAGSRPYQNYGGPPPPPPPPPPPQPPPPSNHSAGLHYGGPPYSSRPAAEDQRSRP